MRQSGPFLALLLVFGVAPFPAAAATLPVPGGYPTIQAAVTAAAPGDTVLVAAGTFTEQIVIGKNLTLRGSGRASTTIASPVTLPVSFVSGSNTYRPIILAQNAGAVRIERLRIDGLGRGNGNFRFAGAAWSNAGGRLFDVDVVHVHETPPGAGDTGVGILAIGTGGPWSLEIGSSQVSDFQKNGLALSGSGLSVNVHDCVVIGAGPTAAVVQNGLQLSRTAAATLARNELRDIYNTGTGFVAADILIIDAGVTAVTGPTRLKDSQLGLYWQSSSGSASDVQVEGNVRTGVVAYNASGVLLGGSEFPGATPPPAPFDFGDIDGSPASPASPGPGWTAAQAITLDRLCLTGIGLAGSRGLEISSVGGTMLTNLTHSILTGWERGVVIFGTGPHLQAVDNSIAGNALEGLHDYSTAGGAQLERNWWGASSGPSGSWSGAGDALHGVAADFIPWLGGGDDTDTSCVFVPGHAGVIRPLPPGTCLNGLMTSLAIPVVIERTDGTPMRGFSVRIQLSSGLTLAPGPAGVQEGNYLPSAGTTAFQVVSLGGGAWNVDSAILGSPCGATAAAGTLFTLNVVATGPDGSATVDVIPLKGRDCANASIAVYPGAGVTVTVDRTGPAPVTLLSATPRRHGNDGDGTTRIQLSFTPPAGSSAIEVWRAPFGNYPEYDDAPSAGAEPVASGYPPGPPWALTAVTASGQEDEPSTRDIWYYVAFARDACGNASAASSRTAGAPNYHLGDMSTGLAACAGDNRVATADVSLLGSVYGQSLAPLDPMACVDIGPTLDTTVLTRPVTDNVVDFEDLLILALNYGDVSSPRRPGPTTAGDGRNRLTLDVRPTGSLVEAALLLEAVSLKGLSVDLAFDASVVRPVDVGPGELLSAQSAPAALLSARPGNVDVALLGDGTAINGSGRLAVVRFERISAGDPAIAIGSVRGRDVRNRPVRLDGRVDPATTVTVGLKPAWPNPFRQGLQLRVSLVAAGAARLQIFDLGGRLVRTLVDASMTAGETTVDWDGRDAAGRSVASGLYLARLETGGRSWSQRLLKTE